MFLKIREKKIHDKAFKTYILWLNLDKVKVYNQHINKVTPHFPFMRRVQNADTMHSNSLGCPKIVPLSAPVLYWQSHLTCIPSLKAKNERKTLVFTQLKNTQIQQTFFRYFQMISYKFTSDLFTVLWLHERSWYVQQSLRRTKSSVSQVSLLLSDLSSIACLKDWFLLTVFSARRT